MEGIFLIKNSKISVPNEILNYISENFNVCNYVCAKKIIVLGGDGTMLNAIRSWANLEIPFFGLNYGHKGFLLNTPEIQKITELKEGEIETVTTKLLKCYVLNKELGPVPFAFNDLYFERTSPQTAKIKVTINGKLYFDPLICDGIIVSSAAGSTAYNAAAGGIILPIENDSMVITGICPAVYHNWRTAQLSHNAKIILEPIETKKRPVRFLADGIEIPKVNKVEIGYSKKTVKLIFAKSENFRNKILNLQLANV